MTPFIHTLFYILSFNFVYDLPRRSFLALEYPHQLYQLSFLILICRLYRRLEYDLPTYTMQTVHFMLYLACFVFYVYFMSYRFGPSRLYIT